MTKQKPGIPKGTRDFGPAEMARRTYILDLIRNVYQRYGFQPLETPSMENLSVLTGKYGDEGDKLLYRVLDSGDFFQSIRERLPEIKDIPYLGDIFIQLSKLIIELIIKEDIRDLNKINSRVNDYSVNLKWSEIAQKISSHLYISHSTVEALENYLRDNSFEITNSITSFVGKARLWEKNNNKLDFHLHQYKNTDINGKFLPDFIENYLLNPKELDSSQIVEDITKKGLRYDLTVPFARYVVMNQHDITFPFRRYQIQPVWRADRPQKGRYREFYQCDADVVGTDSLICEAEIVLMLEEVFAQLRLRDISIKINNRKILSGVVEVLGVQGKESDLLVAIDKLDKIGREKVMAELQERGFGQDALNRLTPLFELKGSNHEQLNQLRDMLSASEIGMQGISEIEEVIERVQLMESEGSSLAFDVTLARGLSYYTGAIFEVKANNASMSSSISGGGRYDNLTGVFGMPGMSGVGISFGVDRIYDVMEELKLFPEESLEGTRVLLISFDEATEKHGMSLLSQIRKAGISAEIYPDRVKLKKQFAYADKKGIPYTLVIGSQEMEQQAYGLKNLKSGEQDTLSLPEIIQRLKQ